MRDPISAARAGDLPGLLRERVARTPDTVAYRECQAGVWRALRWREIAERVARWRGALCAAGLERGDRVLVMLPNSVDWVCADLAALNRLIHEVLLPHRAVARVQSQIVMDQLKHDAPLPL